MQCKRRFERSALATVARAPRNAMLLCMYSSSWKSHDGRPHFLRRWRDSSPYAAYAGRRCVSFSGAWLHPSEIRHFATGHVGIMNQAARATLTGLIQRARGSKIWATRLHEYRSHLNLGLFLNKHTQWRDPGHKSHHQSGCWARRKHTRFCASHLSLPQKKEAVQMPIQVGLAVLLPC